MIDLDEQTHEKTKFKSPLAPSKKNQVAPEPVMKVNKSEGMSLLELEDDSNAAPVMAA